MKKTSPRSENTKSKGNGAQTGALSTHPLSRQDCRFHDIVYHTKNEKSIERDEKMRRKRFCRLGALVTVIFLLLSVSAVPAMAYPVLPEISDDFNFIESTDVNQQTGYEVSGFDHIKTSGSDLKGSFQYTTGVIGAQYPIPGYLVTLQPNTWYYLKYTESVVMTGSAATSYIFYRKGKEVFSYLSKTRSELLFYTGTDSGACNLLLEGSKTDIGINKYSLYQVDSFDTLYLHALERAGRD